MWQACLWIQGYGTPYSAVFGDNGRDCVGKWREALDRGAAQRELLNISGLPVDRAVVPRAEKGVTSTSCHHPSTQATLASRADAETAMWWKNSDITKDLDYFVASVEFAVAQFNEDNMGEFTNRLLEVQRAQQVHRTFVVDARPWIPRFNPLNSTSNAETGGGRAPGFLRQKPSLPLECG
ncbi:hypothetical protein P7K49_009214, partial [Saguinus oedipus]